LDPGQFSTLAKTYHLKTFLEGESLSKENSEELAKWLENLLGKQKVAGVKVC
jgi:hypothetical protein